MFRNQTLPKRLATTYQQLNIVLSGTLIHEMKQGDQIGPMLTSGVRTSYIAMPIGFDSSAVLFAESLNYMLCKQYFARFVPRSALQTWHRQSYMVELE